MNHICTVHTQASTSFLPQLSPHSNFFKRTWRKWKKSCLISEKNPMTSEYYRSYAEILEIRKKHAASGSRMIHPFSMFRLFYEMWMSFVLLLAMLYMPIDGTFIFNEGVLIFKLFFYIDKFLTIALIVDILLNFCTGYVIESNRKVVMKPLKVAKHYLTSFYFPADVLSSLPNLSFLIGNDKVQTFRRFFSFLKIFRLRTMDKYMDRSAQYFHLKTNLFRVIKMIFITTVVCHWLGCLNILVPRLRLLIFDQPIHNGSWLNQMQISILNTSFTKKYTRSYYKASSTVFGISNGIDVLFAGWEEDLLTITSIIFGKVFVLFITVTLIQIFMASSNLEVKYEEIISQVEAFMTRKKLPLALQKRMLEYYNFKYHKKFFKENVITELLSEKINKEINVNVSLKLVNNVPIFQQLSPKDLEDVLAQLEMEIYLANDIIISAGNLGDCMYFLASGTVAVLTPSGREVCHLQDGAYFGEISLIIKGKTRTANIIALEICEVYKLERRDFRRCFAKTTDIFKKMEEDARERLKATELLEDAQIRAFMME